MTEFCNPVTSINCNKPILKFEAQQQTILVLEIITIVNKHIKIGEGRRIDWLTCKEMGFLSVDMEAPARKVDNEGWKLEYNWREKKWVVRLKRKGN